MAEWWYYDSATKSRSRVKETRYLRRYRRQGWKSAPTPVAQWWHKTKPGKYRLLAKPAATGAARSTLSARVLAKGLGTRLIPGPVGWAFIAYDVYSLASWWAEKQSVKSPEAHVDPFLFEVIADSRYVVGYQDTSISPWRTM